MISLDYTTTMTSFSVTDEMPHVARNTSGHLVLFRPLWVEIRRHSTGDGWEAVVTGARVRKDGSDGIRTEVRYSAYTRHAEIPAYVHEAVVKAHIPPDGLPG